MAHGNSVFLNFIYRCGGEISPALRVTPLVTDFFPPLAGERVTRLGWSNFSALKDSFFYSTLLRESLRRHGNRIPYTDLCTGSGIPFLSATLHEVGDRPRIRASLFDLDEAAVALSAKNIRALGLDPWINAEMCSIEEFLSDLPAEPQIISVNPPYIPFPEESVPRDFVAIAAGTDGLALTAPFLRAHHHRDSRLVLECSSLSDPSALVALIEENFSVEYCTAQRIAFGKYTRSEPIRSYLEERRRAGKSEFEGAQGSEFQILCGLILKPL